MGTKTLNEWLRDYGYVWVEGQERLQKGRISMGEAEHEINQLEQEGAIRRG